MDKGKHASDTRTCAASAVVARRSRVREEASDFELTAPRSAESTPGDASQVAQVHQVSRVLRLALAAKHLQIPEATLRDVRFHSSPRFGASGRVIQGNGFAGAFLTLGRAVYIDLTVFEQIWRSTQPKGGAHG